MRVKLLGDICEYPGCFRKPVAHDLCSSHYRQSRSGKELTKLRERTPPNETPSLCQEEGCNDEFYSNNLCSYHYYKTWLTKRRQKKNVGNTTELNKKE